MSKPQPDDSSRAPQTAHYYWLLTAFCLCIIATLSWAWRLEHTVRDQNLSLDEAADGLHVDLLTAHLRFEEFLGGQHEDAQPDAEALTWQNLDGAQKDISTLLDTSGSAEKQFFSITGDPGWQGCLRDLQGKIAAWRRVIEQRTTTAGDTARGDQLAIEFHALFIDLSNDLSTLTGYQHTLVAEQMRKMRMMQAALLALALMLIVLVVKIFRRLIGGQLIETQRSRAQLLRRVTEMATLNALGRISNIEVSPEILARNSLTAITDLIRPDIASIYSCHEDAMLLLAAYQPSAPDHESILPDHKVVGRCLCGLAAQGSPVYSTDIHADPRCTLPECRDAGLRSFAALPLLSGEKVIGVLGLGFSVEQDLASQHVLLESLADQVATGLQKCHLYSLNQQQYGKMQEQIELLSLGSAINTALTQNTTLREMLDACCSLLVSHLGGAFARIWVIQEPDGILELQASAGMYTRIDGISRCKAVDQSNKIGAIAVSKQPYFSNQLLGDPQIINQEWVKQEKMVSFAGHPLMIGEQVIGVLAMFSCHPLSAMVQKVFAASADAISLAIDNKKAVQRLKLSHERYRDLIENISDWIWVVDDKAVFTFSSPQVSRMLGHEAQEVIGRTPFSFMPESEAERVREIFDDIASSQQPFVGLENIHLHQDGRQVILDTSGSPIFDEHGQFAGYRGINRDITAKKAAENAVLDQKRMLEAMFNAVPDAMIFTNNDNQAEMINHGFTKMFGYAVHEMLRQDICLLYDNLEEFTLPPPPPLPLHDHGQPLPLEIKCKRKNGEAFPAETVSVAIKNTEGEVIGFLHLVRDISQRKQMEASQRHTQKMEALGTLSGGIAHDFNNLLNVINGYTALTIDDLDKDSPAANNLQEVVKASERATALVRQILAFSKGVEEGMNPLFLHHIAKEVAKLMAGTLPATIEIKQRIDATCRAVMADASQIHQVLMNLCTNAYHAMREQGGILIISLNEEELINGAVAALPTGPYAKLSVADSGHGMDQAVQDRIFEPYFTTKKMGEGTGLGLATVHGIVKAHGGHIAVISEIGKGSTFTIYLPIVSHSAIPVPGKDAPAEIVVKQLKANILYVDDVGFNVDLGEKILTKCGCQVTGKTDSTAALTLFAAAPERFDLVITDQTMPKMSGLDMAKEMIAIRADLPVIMVSGHSDTVDEEKARAVGIRDFLPKPLNIEQLISAIGKILRQAGTRQIPSCATQPAVQHNRRSEDKARVPASLEAIRSHLGATYGVDQEQLAPMLTSIQETLRSELDRARTASGQNDLTTLGLAAHTIKGVLLNGGVDAWAALAKAIELSAKSGESGESGEAKAYDTMLDELERGLVPLLSQLPA